jgi:hypothetical protein
MTGDQLTTANITFAQRQAIRTCESRLVAAKDVPIGRVH